MDKILQWEVINLCSPIVKKCNNGGECECPENAKYCKILNLDLVNKYNEECDEEYNEECNEECDEEYGEECGEEFDEEKYKKILFIFS